MFVVQIHRRKMKKLLGRACSDLRSDHMTIIRRSVKIRQRRLKGEPPITMTLNHRYRNRRERQQLPVLTGDKEAEANQIVENATRKVEALTRFVRKI